MIYQENVRTVKVNLMYTFLEIGQRKDVFGHFNDITYRNIMGSFNKYVTEKLSILTPPTLLCNGL